MLELENEYLSIVAKRQGAELTSIVNRKDNSERLWQANPDIWARHAPVLFPFVGKLKNDTYEWNGKSYPMPQHGFARDREFNLLEKNGAKMVMELTDDEESYIFFPFRFNLQVEYVLQDKKLSCHYHILNPGIEALYFSIGAHPAFLCDLNSECSIEFEKPETVSRYILEKGLITDHAESVLDNSKKLALNKSLFDRDAIVFRNLRSESLVLHSKFSSMKFSWYNMPYFGIWTKPGTDKFVCLEPWAGIADHKDSTGKLMEKEGIRKLEPGETMSCGFSIEF
jgi:galactose mutarotase-like enzyme